MRMKDILMIATGGTIASKPTENGLQPSMTAEEILMRVPALEDKCRVKGVQLFDLDSTNMRPEHWLAIAALIEEHYGEFDGFVVTHGTDTLSYTAAALSYLVQRSIKPIALTGSQKSIFTEDTDARRNLLDAFSYASDVRSHGVCVVFDGKVIAGTRARKMRTKSMNAFSSVDYPELAALLDGRILRYFYEPEMQPRPSFYRALNDRVFVLKLIPGMGADIFGFLTDSVDALIIESFGVGGVPCYGDEDFLTAIERWCGAGKTLVFTTQVPYEGSDMGIYQVGLKVKQKYDVIEAYNMTLESTVTKLMWILAQTRDPRRVREMFYTPVAHDLLLF
jgi:L-asparaginase